MARPFSVDSRLSKLAAIQRLVETATTKVRKLTAELAEHEENSKAHRYALKLEGALERAAGVKAP